MRKCTRLIMTTPMNVLLMECRMALRLTQKDFGNLFGKTARTVQRWENHGAILIPAEIETLARALIPVRPDLAEQIAAVGKTTLDQLGIAPTADASTMAVLDDVDSIVRAAATALRMLPEEMRPAVAAAFGRALELGMDVQTVTKVLSRQ
jgi:hypothetical protein